MVEESESPGEHAGNQKALTEREPPPPVLRSQECPVTPSSGRILGQPLPVMMQNSQAFPRANTQLFSSTKAMTVSRCSTVRNTSGLGPPFGHRAPKPLAFPE